MLPNPPAPESRRRALPRGLAWAVLGLVVVACLTVAGMRSRVKKVEGPQAPVSVLSEDLKQLEGMRDELVSLEAGMRDQFARQLAESAPQAAVKAAVAQDAALAAQRDIVSALEGTIGDLALFSAKRSNANFDQVYAAHEKAIDHQAEILSSQERSLGLLSLARPDHPLVAAQKEARELQISVGTALDELADARDLARGSRLRTPDERKYEHHTYHVVRAERRQATIPAELEALAARAASLSSMEESVARELAATADAASKTRLEQQRDAVSKALADLNKRRKDAEKNLANSSDSLAKHRPKVAELETILANAPQQPTAEDAKVMELQRKAISLQLRAIEMQASARKALDGFPTTVDPEALAKVMALLNTGDQAVVPGADACHRAFALEGEIRAGLRRMQAMDMAMSRSIPVASAMATMDPAPLPRPLLSQEDSSAGDKVDSIVEGSRVLLEQARRLVSQKESPSQRGERIKNLENFISADKTDPARDLTALLDGRGDGLAGLLPGGPGGPPVLDAETVSLPAFSLLHREVSPPPRGWLFVDRWQILGPFDNPQRKNIDTVFPPESLIDLAASYPGKNGVAIEWESVESSTPNVMPPFRGYNRERGINGLDEETAYRHNLLYSIYYAYAELHFENDCDLWIAIGSDDYSKVWINDQPVWTSGRNSKAWRRDEGFRKVHFKAGVNRVLYRVENGDDKTEFSLLIGMQP